MPTFRLNKLVRDKLKEEYSLDNQIAVYRSLSVDEHKEALKNKIMEEAIEIDLKSSDENIVGEIADMSQAIDDLISIYGISKDQIELKKQSKYEIKGGFENATFVETITLRENDKWLEYYRENPNLFEEL
ncbi:MAG: nucleoside triphosphate pyrophosphohydrolase [Candidatus Saccharibacteria bacterium]